MLIRFSDFVGWRDLLTDEVYNYHVNKPPRNNVKFEGDIVGVEKGTSKSAVSIIIYPMLISPSSVNKKLPLSFSALHTAKFTDDVLL